MIAKEHTSVKNVKIFPYAKNMKTCFKRHPKSCKRFYSGQCKFGKDRAYKHEEQKQNEEQSLMIEKVKQMEKVVHALTRKVIWLETELVEINENNKTNEGDKVIETIKENKTDMDEDISDKICFNPQSSSSPI